MKVKIIILTGLLACVLIAQGQTDDFKRHLVRAETAFKMGNLTEAVVEYKEALKLDSVNANLYYNLAAIQEKIATVEAFQSAIENYKKYLSLLPNSPDKDDVMTKVYALEFKIEDKIKKEKHLENINGTWRSNMFVTKTGVPLWLFSFSLIGDELRITVSSRSALFKSDFTYQTVTIPFNEKSVAFAYTNDKVVAAQNNNAEHTMIDLLASQSRNVSMLSPLLHGVMNATASAGYESLSSYIFKLKVVGDSITGTMQVIEKRIEGNTNKIVGDEIQQITFNKSAENYPIPELTPEEKEAERLASYYLKDDMGMKFGYISTKATSALNGLGYKNGFSVDFISTILNFSTKRTPVKLGMYLNDAAELFISTKDQTIPDSKRNVLLNLSFCIGPALTIFPARSTAFSFYYNLRPGMLFDFTNIIVPDEGLRLIFLQGYGINFRYKKLSLNYAYNFGKTKMQATDSKINLAYSVFSIGFMF